MDHVILMVPVDIMRIIELLLVIIQLVRLYVVIVMVGPCLLVKRLFALLTHYLILMDLLNRLPFISTHLTPIINYRRTFLRYDILKRLDILLMVLVGHIHQFRWLEPHLTMDVAAWTYGLDKALSHLLDLDLLVLDPFPESLDLGEWQHHGNQILLDPVLLVVELAQLKSQCIDFLNQLLIDELESINLLSIQLKPKLQFLSILALLVKLLRLDLIPQFSLCFN